MPPLLKTAPVHAPRPSPRPKGAAPKALKPSKAAEVAAKTKKYLEERKAKSDAFWKEAADRDAAWRKELAEAQERWERLMARQEAHDAELQHRTALGASAPPPGRVTPPSGPDTTSHLDEKHNNVTISEQFNPRTNKKETYYRTTGKPEPPPREDVPHITYDELKRRFEELGPAGGEQIRLKDLQELMKSPLPVAPEKSVFPTTERKQVSAASHTPRFNSRADFDAYMKELRANERKTPAPGPALPGVEPMPDSLMELWEDKQKHPGEFKSPSGKYVTLPTPDGKKWKVPAELVDDTLGDTPTYLKRGEQLRNYFNTKLQEIDSGLPAPKGYNRRKFGTFTPFSYEKMVDDKYRYAMGTITPESMEHLIEAKVRNSGEYIGAQMSLQGSPIPRDPVFNSIARRHGGTKMLVLRALQRAKSAGVTKIGAGALAGALATWAIGEMRKQEQERMYDHPAGPSEPSPRDEQTLIPTGGQESAPVPGKGGKPARQREPWMGSRFAGIGIGAALGATVNIGADVAVDPGVPQRAKDTSLTSDEEKKILDDAEHVRINHSGTAVSEYLAPNPDDNTPEKLLKSGTRVVLGYVDPFGFSDMLADNAHKSGAAPRMGPGNTMGLMMNSAYAKEKEEPHGSDKEILQKESDLLARKSEESTREIVREELRGTGEDFDIDEDTAASLDRLDQIIDGAIEDNSISDGYMMDGDPRNGTGFIPPNSVLRTVAPNRPFGSVDTSLVKSSPLYPRDHMSQEEWNARKRWQDDHPFMEGDMLSERLNDNRARTLKTTIPTDPVVEAADQFHPTDRYDPITNPRDRMIPLATRTAAPDEANNPLSYEWTSNSLRKDERQAEFMVPIDYDTTKVPAVPANVDAFTSFDKGRPFRSTSAAPGGDLTHTPFVVGIGFDEQTGRDTNFKGIPGDNAPAARPTSKAAEGAQSEAQNPSLQTDKEIDSVSGAIQKSVSSTGKHKEDSISGAINRSVATTKRPNEALNSANYHNPQFKRRRAPEIPSGGNIPTMQ